VLGNADGIGGVPRQCPGGEGDEPGGLVGGDAKQAELGLGELVDLVSVTRSRCRWYIREPEYVAAS
jgi:hypothetical protein